MFVHVATYTPHEGHGKAQLREYDNKSQLQYYRSQGNHAQANFFKKLIQTKSREDTCRLPFNEGFLKLVAGEDFSEKFVKELRKIDLKTGFAKKGQTVNPYVMTLIAHTGARKNNFSTLINGMNMVVEGAATDKKSAILRDKLVSILPPTAKINALDINECAKRINGYLKQFRHQALRLKPEIEAQVNLASHLLNYRIRRVALMKKSLAKLHLKTICVKQSPDYSTNLFIRLYPECTDTSDVYTEGVTNVLLSFFAGIVNHLAEIRGARLYTARRQSFGFLRPTVTDAGCLVIRLSLGLEPKTFDALVVDSLKALDKLLGQFTFDDKENASVKHVFAFTELKKAAKKSEKPKTAEKPRKPRARDTLIRNAVRKDNKTLSTFNQAKAYIDKAYNDGGDDYLTQAMTDFLHSFICQNKLLPTTASRPLSKQIFKAVSINAPCVKLLKNTLLYVSGFTKKLTFLAEHEPLSDFSNAYLHSLSKLWVNCDKGHHLLAKLDTTDETEFNFQALLLIETILEYLISLTSLHGIQLSMKGTSIDAVSELRANELSYVKRELKVKDTQVDVFFTDSGQQAITSALLTLSVELHGRGAKGECTDADIYLFDESYYEVTSFIADCKKDNLTLETKTMSKASIVFADISKIHKLDLSKCTAARALVIDITNYPLLDKAEIKTIIATALLKNISVTLVESYLKHSQLGLDKYQAGKITTIMPAKLCLSELSIDLLTPISENAMPQATAAYLLMVGAICDVKTPKQAAPKIFGKAMRRQGLFQNVSDKEKNHLPQPAKKLFKMT